MGIKLETLTNRLQIHRKLEGSLLNRTCFLKVPLEYFLKFNQLYVQRKFRNRDKPLENSLIRHYILQVSFFALARLKTNRTIRSLRKYFSGIIVVTHYTAFVILLKSTMEKFHQISLRDTLIIGLFQKMKIIPTSSIEDIDFFEVNFTMTLPSPLDGIPRYFFSNFCMPPENPTIFTLTLWSISLIFLTEGCGFLHPIPKLYDELN